MTNRLIANNERYYIYQPANDWDMNYRLVDILTFDVWLIDICDVANDVEELEQYDALILWQDILQLNIPAIKNAAWTYKKGVWE